MEPTFTTLVKVIIAALAGLGILGFFGVSWPIKIRVIAAMIIGVVLVGFAAWPFVKPADPLAPVTVFGGNISFFDAAVCLVLAYAAGLIAALVSVPYSTAIGPLATPTGLAVWALQPGDMTALVRYNATLVQRQRLYSILRWEGIFWLAIIAAGYLGVITANIIVNKTKPAPAQHNKNSMSSAKVLTAAATIIITTVIAQFAIGILAQDVRMYDSHFGSVVGQPSVKQIAFAVLVSFALAAFLVRKFLATNVVFCISASAVLVYLALTVSAQKDVLAYMVSNWPVAFYPRSMCAILPVQIVAFAAIGSVAGYRLAARIEDSSKKLHTKTDN